MKGWKYVLEEVIGTSQLLERLNPDTQQDSIHHSLPFEHFQYSRLGIFFSKLLLEIQHHVSHYAVVLTDTMEFRNVLAGLVNVPISEVESWSLGEE